MIFTDEGYVEKVGDKFNYYYLKDHQGNNRMVLNASGEVVQSTNYYSFGIPMWEGVNDKNTQPYKYNGKELDQLFGVNLYDYGARQYDPALARFTSMDPMAEKYYSISPYAYCANNPVKYTDPTGKWLESAWDAFSLATGIESLVSNVRKGNVVDAIVDVGGIALDAVAIVLPVVPGGAGVAIKGARAAEKAVDIARVADKTAEGVKTIDKIENTQKAIGPIGDPGATVMKQLPEKMQSNARVSNNNNGTLFKDPNNPKGNHVRVQNADKSSPYPSQQTPYVKETRNGKSVDVNGYPTTPKSPEAHIPKEEYKYKQE